MRTTAGLLCSLALSFGSGTAHGDSIAVPGDHVSVHEALWAASPGDSVMLAEGYHPNYFLSPYEVGPGVSVIGDGDVDLVEWFIGVGLTFPPGADGTALVENVTLQMATVERGIEMYHPRATLRDCRLHDVDGQWTAITVLGGGVISGCYLSAGPFIGVHVVGGETLIEGNLFSGCYSQGSDQPLIVELADSRVMIRNNTFLDSSDLLTIVPSTKSSGHVEIVNNIFGGDGYSGVLRCLGEGVYDGIHVHHNLFASGPDEPGWDPFECDGLVAGDGNLFDVDPLFCGIGEDCAEQYALDAASPALGAGEGGVTMGAFDVGCGVLGAEAPELAGEPFLVGAAWPNPSREWVRLLLGHGLDGTALEATVFDVAGRKVGEAHVHRRELLWTPDKGTGSGVYFIRAVDRRSGHVGTRQVQLLRK